MSSKKQQIGDPLDDVVATGKIGGTKPAPQTYSSPAVQQSSSPASQISDNELDLQQSRSLKAQKSKSPEVNDQKTKRMQQTIYLPQELLKWLRIRAIEEGREISEVAASAIETYRRLQG